MGLPSQGLSEMVGADISRCEPSARAIRRRCIEDLALGGLERTGHWILARNSAGILQTVRFQCECRIEGLPSRENWRAGHDRRGLAQSCGISAAFSGALRA